MASKFTGRVMEVLIEEGQRVAKDEVLARLDDSNSQIALAQARAQLAQAMSTGLIKSMQSAGRDDRAIVVRQGAVAENSSILTTTAAIKIKDAPGIKRDEVGQPIVSAEISSLVILTRKDGNEVSVPMRGVGTNAFKLRPEIKLIEGRMFEPAVYEMIVGKNANMQYQGLDVGSEVNLRGAIWKVVGMFESGDTHESELMTNNETMATAMRRGGSIQAVTVMLTSASAFNEFKDALTTDPSLAVDVLRETDYFNDRSSNITEILSIVAYVIGGIMAVGAVFAALNTMYSAVSNRAVEIATLRAIGFGAGPIVTSVMVEALALAFIGGVIGALLGWFLFNGYTVSSSAGGVAGESRVFDLYVSPSLVLLGILWASVIGVIGGLFPALRAANLPVATALREL